MKEKKSIVFPDDIFYFDHPKLVCEVNPRITFKMAVGPEAFVDENEDKGDK